MVMVQDEDGQGNLGFGGLTPLTSSLHLFGDAVHALACGEERVLGSTTTIDHARSCCILCGCFSSFAPLDEPRRLDPVSPSRSLRPPAPPTTHRHHISSISAELLFIGDLCGPSILDSQGGEDGRNTTPAVTALSSRKGTYTWDVEHGRSRWLDENGGKIHVNRTPLFPLAPFVPILHPVFSPIPFPSYAVFIHAATASLPTPTFSNLRTPFANPRRVETPRQRTERVAPTNSPWTLPKPSTPRMQMLLHITVIACNGYPTRSVKGIGHEVAGLNHLDGTWILGEAHRLEGVDVDVNPKRKRLIQVVSPTSSFEDPHPHRLSIWSKGRPEERNRRCVSSRFCPHPGIRTSIDPRPNLHHHSLTIPFRAPFTLSLGPQECPGSLP
ncbi:hypothetical protein NMY22_g7643 [Coprinellus aureogranulatus]|nr:hypothetical protein NMY22_g7643 [Coprinellus aureogranulatus]